MPDASVSGPSLSINSPPTHCCLQRPTRVRSPGQAKRHTVTPIVSVVVWLVAGPRGLVSRRTIAPALVLPLAWAVYAIARGKVVGAYPYSFLDVDTQGLVPVLGFVLAIVAFGVVMALAMLVVDRLLVRRSRA